MTWATAGLITGRWRTLAQGLVIYQLSFVVVAIGADLARGRSGSEMRLVNAAVVAFLFLTVVYALARRAEWRCALRFPEGRVLAVGLLFFVVVAVGQNLGELGLRPGSRVPEAIALLVLVCCIGYALALCVGRRETQLAAITPASDFVSPQQCAVIGRAGRSPAFDNRYSGHPSRASLAITDGNRQQLFQRLLILGSDCRYVPAAVGRAAGQLRAV